MEKTINIGDKVRFLNDIGGGKVTGFQRGGIVLVEDEDGFEIPVRENEVVLVSASEKKLTRQSEPAREEQEEEPTYRVKSILAGKSAPTQPSQISNISRHYEYSKPAETESEDNAEVTESMEERIARLERTVKRLQLRIEQLEAAKSLREKLESNGMKVTENNGHKKKDKREDILEVDLHATELLDNTTGMSPADIKEYQIDMVRRTIDEHIKEKGKRIIFIHGNGEGVLRRALLDLLRREYKQCEHQDASFQQYGFGATMVIIH